MVTLPRIIAYHQTIHERDGRYISVLPLVPEQGDALITHLIIGCLHLNEECGDITLNDDKVTRFEELWTELDVLRCRGVSIMAMLGGAAKGTFARLDSEDEEVFLRYYLPLKTILVEYHFDGIDLDVEEEMSLSGIIRLIDQLRQDFGRNFIITLAPVCSAMSGGRHLSGFDYKTLEQTRGSEIDWYHCQYYSGFVGWLDSTIEYDMAIQAGFPAHKLVVGFLTNPENGSGYISHGEMTRVLKELKRRYPNFGGVMGWEYFNALSEDNARKHPSDWAIMMRNILHISGRDGTMD